MPKKIVGATFTKAEYVLLLVLVPAVLIGIYLLPSEIKNLLIMHRESPTPLSVFFSNYTHSDAGHLSANLESYLLAMLMILRLEADKRILYPSLALLFLILPFFASIATLLFVPIPNSQGFSAVVAGLIGYFVYVVYRRLKDGWNVSMPPYLVFAVFIIAMNMLIWQAMVSSSILMVVAIPIVILTIYLSRKPIKEISEKIYEAYALRRHSLLDAAVLALAIIFLFSMGPLIQIAVAGEAVSNAIAHYTGYIFGMLIPPYVLGNLYGRKPRVRDG
ncbi:MAG: rhomboid family intramembrane serine protease [Candidatus Micrarchaeota archaeon]|nr:rhomboid family intramembrane serine protease [Candidatus Micrarchaeota archaeon]